MLKRFLGVVCVITLISGCNEAAYSFSETQRENICKNYIGAIMLKDPSIVNVYDTNNKSQIYVRYTRSIDSTVWSYVCSIKENSAIWAAWQQDQKEWGRWREEDRVNLLVDDNNKTISFKLPIGGKSVTIPL
jgi:hypothetical protein